MSASSDVRAVEALGRDLSRWLGDGTPPPEAEEALRSLIALSGRLASDKAGMTATIAAQEGQIAGLAARIAALTAQIAQLQRDLYGSRSERCKEGGDGSGSDDGADGKDGRRGGRPGRGKERGDAVNDTGLRFNGQVRSQSGATDRLVRGPVIDITVTPPAIEGLSEDDYEVVSERVHCRLAAIECRHVVIRYRHVKVKIRETGALVGAPARESVFKNSCADVSFVAALLIDKFLWHLPLYRQHRMLAAAGITVNRGSLSLWANRAIALLKPIHDAQWRSVLESAVIEMDELTLLSGHMSAFLREHLPRDKNASPHTVDVVPDARRGRIARRRRDEHQPELVARAQAGGLERPVVRHHRLRGRPGRQHRQQRHAQQGRGQAAPQAAGGGK